MDTNKPLSEEEFKTMFRLIKRHAETSMDQWELWKFNSSKGMLFVDLKLSNIANEQSYIDVGELLK